MKNYILKPAMALLFGSMLIFSCNKTNDANNGSTEPDAENTSSSGEYPMSNKSDSNPDSTNLEKVDATRMSDGKDAVKGEVTPPDAQQQ